MKEREKNMMRLQQEEIDRKKEEERKNTRI